MHFSYQTLLDLVFEQGKMADNVKMHVFIPH